MGLTPRDLLITALGTALGAGVLAGILWIRREPPPDPPVLNLSIGLPAGHRVTAMALSPDGRRIVYAAEADRSPRLFVRELERFDVSPVSGTEGAHNPFFSPDGRNVAFFAAGKLRRVPVSGGTAQDLCDAPMDSAGGAWSDDGTIVFAPLRGVGLQRVPAGGGAVTPVTQLNAAAGELAHGWPHLLPQNAGILLTVARKDRDSRVAVLPAGSTALQLLVPANGPASYLSLPEGGAVAYTLDGELLAVDFDPIELKMRGAPVSLMKGMLSTFRGYNATGAAAFGVAASGTLAFVSGPHGDPVNAPVWVDRGGTATALSITAGRYQTPRLSPDARTLAVTKRSDVLSRDVWLYRLGTGAATQLTMVGSDNHAPVWRHDGRAIGFASNRTGGQAIFSQPLNGGTPAVAIRSGPNPQVPSSWSRDGRLAFYEVDAARGRDIWVLDTTGRAQAVVATPADERSPVLSSDGSQLAYVSDASGEDVVFVVFVGGVGGVGGVGSVGSVGGRIGSGTEPVWSRAGRELFYRDGDRMMVWTPAETSGGPAAPRVLFERSYEPDPGGNLPNYDVSPDGQRFLMLRRTDPPSELRLVVNWVTAVARRIPARRN